MNTFIEKYGVALMAQSIQDLINHLPNESKFVLSCIVKAYIRLEIKPDILTLSLKEIQKEEEQPGEAILAAAKSGLFDLSQKQLLLKNEDDPASFPPAFVLIDFASIAYGIMYVKPGSFLKEVMENADFCILSTPAPATKAQQS